MGVVDYKMASNHQQVSVVDKICGSTNSMVLLCVL